ncbi:MAG TPA: cob(I)yrinic acid a,c-diamide adenosyltransferase, partial [Dehalococcoidia bacterium]|nr:cob(I)yrinic acid a,c-diamide adenosyltransferase [Dehalococcoidia bacterium]
GNGKGKTTAAMGLVLRAAGNRMPVLVVQFIKGTWKTGEQESIKALAPHVEMIRTGRGFTIDDLRDPKITQEEHEQAAAEGFRLAREKLLSGRYKLVVLDEILGAIRAELVSLEDVVDLIERKPPDVHLVLTGRGAPPEIVERADLVTEMTEIKHPYHQGIAPQRGIEF